MTLEERIHKAEADLFHTAGAEVDESFLDLATTGVRVRLLVHGSGPPLVLLHGVSLSAAAWAPLIPALLGHRLLAVDLPGHGLSDPASYRRGHVRQPAHQLIEDIFDALEIDHAPVIGHSLGGMLALWHAATGSERISRLVAIGEPAVALPGVRVRMPLSLLTVRGLGVAVLRSPSPRPVYRRLLAQGLGQAEVAAAPDSLIDALRLSARRPENARTVSSLMHAIDHFHRPRPESVLTTQQLAAIATPTMFIWGADAPYLSAERARPSIDQIPSATLHEVPGAHGPWLVDSERSAELIQSHLTNITAPTTSANAPTRVPGARPNHRSPRATGTSNLAAPPSPSRSPITLPPPAHTPERPQSPQSSTSHRNTSDSPTSDSPHSACPADDVGPPPSDVTGEAKVVVP